VCAKGLGLDCSKEPLVSSKVGSKSSGVGACDVGSGDGAGLGCFSKHAGFSDPNVMRYGMT
jgi:hypothetical protein